MRLLRARVQGFRSIRDSGWFHLHGTETLFVGADATGKSALLRALHALNPTEPRTRFDPLHDLPRAECARLQRGEIDPSAVTVARAVFAVDEPLRADLAGIDPALGAVTDVEVGRRLDNVLWIGFPGLRATVDWNEVAADFLTLREALGQRHAPSDLTAQYETLAPGPGSSTLVRGALRDALERWLEAAAGHVEQAQGAVVERLRSVLQRPERFQLARRRVMADLPLFLHFDGTAMLPARIHLPALAECMHSGQTLAPTQFASACLLRMLGLDPSAHTAADPSRPQQWLDGRPYALSSTTAELNRMVHEVHGEEGLQLVLRADGEYLQVMAVDEYGEEVELERRGAALLWLVSFFVVFRDPSRTRAGKVLLLLDQPGRGLDPQRQCALRDTLSLLGAGHQVLLTTNSPYLIEAQALDRVRVVGLEDRARGTQVQDVPDAGSAASLLPLRLRLAQHFWLPILQSPCTLVCEDLVALWYLEAVAGAFRAAGRAAFSPAVRLFPAGGASRLVASAALLGGRNARPAAWLEPACAEDDASQEACRRAFEASRTHRAADFHRGPVVLPTIEDLLRHTLAGIAQEALGWDLGASLQREPARAVCALLSAQMPAGSRTALASAFVRWCATHDAQALSADELQTWGCVFQAIDRSFAGP